MVNGPSNGIAGHFSPVLVGQNSAHMIEGIQHTVEHSKLTACVHTRPNQTNSNLIRFAVER